MVQTHKHRNTTPRFIDCRPLALGFSLIAAARSVFCVLLAGLLILLIYLLGGYLLNYMLSQGLIESHKRI